MMVVKGKRGTTSKARIIPPDSLIYMTHWLQSDSQKYRKAFRLRGKEHWTQGLGLISLNDVTESLVNLIWKRFIALVSSLCLAWTQLTPVQIYPPRCSSATFSKILTAAALWLLVIEINEFSNIWIYTLKLERHDYVLRNIISKNW